MIHPQRLAKSATCVLAIFCAIVVSSAQTASRVGYASVDSLIMSDSFTARIVMSGSVTGLRTNPSVVWFGFLPLPNSTPASVVDVSLSPQLRAFPTPASDLVRLILPEEMRSGEVLVKLIDPRGAVVQIFNADARSITFSVASLASGTYAVLIQQSFFVASASIVVHR